MQIIQTLRKGFKKIIRYNSWKTVFTQNPVAYLKTSESSTGGKKHFVVTRNFLGVFFNFHILLNLSLMVRK